MLLQKLKEKKLISPPDYVISNCCYLTIMGSQAYGTNIAESSDWDIYGFCIPPKRIVFPHIEGRILGFGSLGERFEQYQQHHIQDNDKEYDLSIYSIVRYFQLLMDGNPSVLDSLFTPYECVIFSTQIANMVREKRQLFLAKSCFKRYKGYAYSQMHKINTKFPQGGERKESVEKYGLDTKYAMHLVRLLLEIEQILITGDLDMRKDKEQLKAIRRGEMTKDEVFAWATEKEKHLEELYVKSTLPEKPSEDKIKQLLLNCLEHHYGDLSHCIHMPDKYEKAIVSIRQIINDLG